MDCSAAVPVFQLKASIWEVWNIPSRSTPVSSRSSQVIMDCASLCRFLILQHWHPMEHHYKCICFRNYSNFRNCHQQQSLCVFPSVFSTFFSFINKIQAVSIPQRTCKIIKCKVCLFNSHLTWQLGRRRLFAKLLSRPNKTSSRQN